MSSDKRKDGKKQESVNFSLLENGLDFVLSAIAHLSDNPGKRELKYAVLHLCAGIELVLKERLRQEHWSLLFRKIDDAKKESYEKGDFSSAAFDECIRRVAEICEVDLATDYKDDLLRFRKKRNQMEHFGFVDSRHALVSSAAKGLVFLIDLIKSEFDPETLSPEERAMLDKIRTEKSKFEEYVSQRWVLIRSEVDDAKIPVLACPQCGQMAALVEDGMQCLFCGYRDSAEAAADAYITSVLGLDEYRTVKDGGEWPLYTCPECGKEAVVDHWGEEKVSNRFVCFGCGAAWEDLEFCSCCGGLYDPGEDGPTICDDCMEMKMERD